MEALTLKFMFLLTVILSTKSHVLNDEMVLEKFNVVPDIISEAPKERIVIRYGNITIAIGEEYETKKVWDPPTQIKWPAEKGCYYTLIMTDPDVPKVGDVTAIQHHLVVNIPGNDVTQGETIWPYWGAAPPEGSGIHRYVFLVYKQNGILDPSAYSNFKDGKRGSISTRQRNTVKSVLAQLHLSDLVAINFFRSQFDKDVPQFTEELYSKFSDSPEED